MDIKKMLLLGLCVPTLVFGVAACSSDDDNDSASTGTTTEATDGGTTDATASEKNIVETAQATPELSTLVDAVVAADLVKTLSGPGPYTVFAPDNAAFNNIKPVVNELLKPANKAELANVLTYHVVAGDVKAADLSDGQMIETVQGQKLKVTIKGDKVMIDDIQVVQPDIETSNGTVHVIDGVLIPKQ